MNRLKNIAQGIFSHWFLMILNLAISLFMAPFIINTLGTLYFGLWVTLMQFTGYLYLLDCGLRNTIVHRTAQAIGGRRKKTLLPLISVSLIISTALAILTIAIIAILSQVVFNYIDLETVSSTEASLTLMIGGLTIALAIWANPYEGVVRGFGLFFIINVYGVFSLLIRTGLTVYLLLDGYKIVALASVQLVISILRTIFIIFLAKKHLKINHFIKKKSKLTRLRFIALAKNIWSYSWSILVDNFSQKLIFSSDILIVSSILTVPLAAFYAVGNQLIEYLRGLITASMSVIMPVASEIAGENNKSDLKSLLINSTRFTVWFALPVFTMYIVLGKTFIGLWIGAEYAEQAGQILIILAITQIIALQQYGITTVLRSIEKHKVIAYVRVVEAIINIILSIVLALKYGLVGVALGTAISHTFVTAVILPYIMMKEIDIKYFEFIIPTYLKTSIVCLIIGITAAALNYYNPANNLLIFFMYGALLAILYLTMSYIFILKTNERTNLLIKLKIIQP